jgi:predicted ATPase/DNA-binding CsgD family transcriptional regulator
VPKAAPASTLVVDPSVSTAHDTTRRQGNLPSELSSFVGRAGELSRLAQVARDAHLLTLVGPGGVGKSRLALRLAARVSPNYSDGIWLVDLASVSDADLLPQAVADVLGLGEQARQSWVSTLASKLRDRAVLLILDNCEHLVAACAEAATALLQAYPRLHIIATSREPLRVSGEYVWYVAPLSLPRSTTSEHDRAERSEAVRLFLARARTRAPMFTLTDRNLRLVAQICRRLDGLPLALEIAAARVEALDLADIATRVNTGQALRIRGPRTAHPRQQTLRATLAWSHTLLTKPERVLFRRLAVFANTWTVEAATAVVADVAVPSRAVAEMLDRLVDTSLVTRDRQSGAVRFGMLKIVRHYALERLSEAGEVDRLRRKHAEYVLHLAELSDPELLNAAHAALLEVEQDEVRGALAWALESHKAELGLRLACGAATLWLFRGHYSEGRGWFERLFTLPEADAAVTRADAQRLLARLLILQGEFAMADEWLNDAIERHRATGNHLGLALALNLLGGLALWRGDLVQARARLLEALPQLRELRHPTEVSALFNLGTIALEQGEHETALACAAECDAYARAWEQPVGIGEALHLRGAIAAATGQAEEAERLQRQALAVVRPLGWFGLRGLVLAELAHTLMDLGRAVDARELLAELVHTTYRAGERVRFARALEGMARSVAVDLPDEAVRLAAAAAALRDRLGVVPWPRDIRHSAWLRQAQLELGEDAYRAAWSAGHALREAEALEVAQAVLSRPHHSVEHGVPPLTPREKEVAVLLARGLSTAEIADELVVTIATVRVHVEHILRKLHLHSRTQVMLWVREHGPLDAGPTTAAAPVPALSDRG